MLRHCKKSNPILSLLTIAIMTAMLLSLSTLPKQSAFISALANTAALPNSQSSPAKTTTTTAAANNTNFLTYQNPISGIKIQYPSG
jgi:cell division protein ZapA (FtsZ GTPase activity inhibitor)